MSSLIRRLRELLGAIIDALRGIAWRPRCAIAWRPTALAPVFYGYRDFGTAEGAPGDVRVFYPSLDGSPASSEILKDCGKYPLVVFAHGHCNTDNDHFLKWFEVPAQLARAGYVVAVPRLPEIAAGTSPLQANGDLAILRNLISWMRSHWSDRGVVAAPPATGLVGHSFGAGLAGRLATEGSVTAFASLSGSVARAIREAISAPKLFVWGSGEFVPPGVALTDAEWASVGSPKHRAVVDDLEHWDYLPPGRTSCEVGRGPCGPFWMTWDLVTMFLANHLRPPAVSTLPSQIPESLVPPLPLTLTEDQQFFAGGWLSGFPAFADEASTCQLTISWDTAGGAGTLTLP